jgi:tetratricopeptide (TPR) repeat protein
MRTLLRNKRKADLLAFILSTCLLLWSTSIIAKSVTPTVAPPKDPTQSITYWKSQVIDPTTSADIAMAHSVFDVLLRTWDTARVEPNLYVVNSSAGPWAASLADGNILLSKSAIEVCKKYGKQYAEHLLAFILGHELAHQRAEDLWHQKFLRLAGSQAPEIQTQLLRDLEINPDSIAQLETREAQADHDGLLIMSSVGYDPFKVIDHKDFFTTWVENLWQVSCGKQNLEKSVVHACDKARTRALRTRAQLTTVATKNTLFELGVQSYVAGNYQQARHYFSAFGKEYPNSSIFTNIGLTYLQQSIEIENEIVKLDSRRTNFLYPITLAENPFPGTDNQSLAMSSKRGAMDILIAQLTAKKHTQVEKAIEQFEKAIRLQPDNRLNYSLLASSYLVDDNLFMSRGILQGKYVPKFGEDAASNNLLAITNFKEKKYEKSIGLFNAALNTPDGKEIPAVSSQPDKYISSYNLASAYRHLGKPDDEEKVWKLLARTANKEGNGYLFQMAVSHINSNAIETKAVKRSIVINHHLNTPHEVNLQEASTVNELWLDGRKYLVVLDRNGNKKIIDDESHIVAVSNVHPILKRSARTSNAKMVSVGDSADRPLKLFGIPSRNIQLSSGSYLAYDNLALAVHIINGTVVDWFLYDKKN